MHKCFHTLPISLLFSRGFGQRTQMAYCGRVIWALFALLFSAALAAPRQHVFGFGKRAVLEIPEREEQFIAYKRPMYSLKGAKFNMGFGKRGVNRQFTMGFGKRSSDFDTFESAYEY